MRDNAQAILKQGGVIAYPTEAVFGLGCDPYNADAVEKILSIKKRPQSAGVILIIARWDQLNNLTQPLSNELMEKLKSTWPGHTTWLLPKSDNIPEWISGEHDKVAIRMTNHPVAKALCEIMPLVSTSANLRGEPSAVSYEEVKAQFENQVDLIIDAPVGGEKKASAIYDGISGQKLR